MSFHKFCGFVGGLLLSTTVFSATLYRHADIYGKDITAEICESMRAPMTENFKTKFNLEAVKSSCQLHEVDGVSRWAVTFVFDSDNLIPRSFRIDSVVENFKYLLLYNVTETRTRIDTEWNGETWIYVEVPYDVTVPVYEWRQLTITAMEECSRLSDVLTDGRELVQTQGEESTMVRLLVRGFTCTTSPSDPAPRLSVFQEVRAAP